MTSPSVSPAVQGSQTRYVLSGVLWVGVYLTLVLTPLFVLLIGPTPTGLGFWWDLSLALGFAGTAMMGVQFLLTARFRRATAPFGIDIIYYFHRYIAVMALVIVLAHPIILFVVNPALLDFLDPFIAPWHMTAGVGSVVALAALVTTSLWRKRLRIHYDGWRVWHAALAVTAVALALLHIHGVGYYIATPWKRALWIAIGVSLIAVVGYVRLVKPWLLRTRPWRVDAVTEERGNAWTLGLVPETHTGFDFAPGQFVWLTLGRSPFAMKEHPFSVSSSPAPSGRIEITIKALGDFTATIRGVARGETAYVDGPYGAFSIDRHPAPGYVFIAGGIGIAPMMGMLRALGDRGDQRPLLLVYAYRRWERLTFRDALAALQGRLNLRIVHVLEEPPDGWEGETGRVTPELLDRHLPAERAELEYFICGPTLMTEAVERALYRLGVPLRRLHSELFDLV